MKKDDIINELTEEIKNLINNKYKQIKHLLDDTVLSILNTTKDQFDKWYNLLESNEISEEEFLWLVKTQQNIIILKALQGKGISKIKQKLILEDIILIIGNALIKWIIDTK
ncbi:hypothetical protein [Flavobacterium oreochromis]|uniref:Uncharacterized protein n=1 Tax=Flavobacterium oreochromis TaxID=2906078 RepID=A0ABW8P748_9FLAO|nr:hypothetical protein [Flavobacterium oreochromis]OWP78299.1 hypothetical protein BWG23_02160 [Flavobacterium oreochromis]POR22869.1 hypothetical protein BWK58_10515 [Flavobacterium columnare]QYS85528.1 hypothetical protein JJC03_09910 [Flavobacterium oreochromis]